MIHILLFQSSLSSNMIIYKITQKEYFKYFYKYSSHQPYDEFNFYDIISI